MSVMYQCYSVIIDRGISAPGHNKEVVDGLNAIDKGYIYQLISNVQLNGPNLFYSQIHIHSGNQNNYSDHHLLQYGKTLMVVPNNTYVPLNCTLCQ